MYKTQIVIISLAFVLIATFLGIRLVKIKPQDFATYEELIRSSNPSKETKSTISQQQREEITKEILFQGDDPLRLLIKSRCSELFFFDEERHTEVIEEFLDVRALVQEELFYLLPDGR